MFYWTVDCYPRTDSDPFRESAGCIVGCWIRGDLCKNEVEIEELVERRLSSIGWSAACVLTREEVSADNYSENVDGRKFFEQAGVDGFVASLHVIRRETVWRGEPGDPSGTDRLVKVASRAAEQGLVGLYSRKLTQWANGVTPRGDVFVPLWLTSAQASIWVEHWPEYSARELSVPQLRDLLERIGNDSIWVGLGADNECVLTCHPMWIQEEVLGNNG